MSYSDNCSLCGESYDSDNLLDCTACSRSVCYRCTSNWPGMCERCGAEEDKRQQAATAPAEPRPPAESS